MDPELYQSHLLMAYATAHMIMDMPLGEMRDAINHAEAVAPIFDPTAFIRNGKKLSEDGQVVAILARAADELRKLPWPAKAVQP